MDALLKCEGNDNQPLETALKLSEILVSAIQDEIDVRGNCKINRVGRSFKQAKDRIGGDLLTVDFEDYPFAHCRGYVIACYT